MSLSIALASPHMVLPLIVFAIITGFFTSLYSMADGMGARINEDAISYYSAMTIANGIVFAIFIKIFQKNFLSVLHFYN